MSDEQRGRDLAEQVLTTPELKVVIYTPLPETDTLAKLHHLMATELAVHVG